MLKKLIDLKDSGKLKEFIDAGLISTKVNFYIEVGLYFDAQKKTSTKKTTQIVEELCTMMNVTEGTIYKIIKVLKINNGENKKSS